MKKYRTTFSLNKDIKLIFETSDPIQQLEPYHWQGVFIDIKGNRAVLQPYAQTDPPLEKLDSILSCLFEDIQNNDDRAKGKTLKENVTGRAEST